MIQGLNNCTKKFNFFRLSWCKIHLFCYVRTEILCNLWRLAKDLKSPEFFQDNDFKVIFWRPTSANENINAEQSVKMVPDRVKRLLRIMDGELSISEILRLLQLKHRGNLMKEYLSPALGKYIEMTLPDTPKSPAQKYRLTSDGLNVKRMLTMALWNDPWGVPRTSHRTS